MRGGAVVVVACLLGAVSLGAGLRRDHRPQVDPAQSDFAARINTACRHGYEAYDWQIRDEFHTDIPPGMVKVTCIRHGNGGGLDQYPVAVPR